MTFALSPLQKSIEEAARNNEKIILQEIASGINYAQISPKGTEYKVPIFVKGKDRCSLDIRNGIVRLEFVESGKKSILFSSYIVTPVFVKFSPQNTGQPYDCTTGSITIRKLDNVVDIS